MKDHIEKSDIKTFEPWNRSMVDLFIDQANANLAELLMAHDFDCVDEWWQVASKLEEMAICADKHELVKVCAQAKQQYCEADKHDRAIIFNMITQETENAIATINQ